MQFKIAVDCVIIGFDIQTSSLKVLFTRRTKEPHQGQYALPGGFVYKTESFNETAKSILERETSLQNVYLSQLKAYSLTDTSTTNRIASVAYYSLVKFDDLKSVANHQASEWFNFKDIPSLPFDHSKKVDDAIKRIKELVKSEPVVYHLLPSKFPINQLQKFYEELYNVKIDNRNFRKKIQRLAFIEKLGEFESNVSHRPSNLYQFNLKKYKDTTSLY